ncbi:hypothetical protein CMUS01_16739, partial [Colletotrichum musicola]
METRQYREWGVAALVQSIIMAHFRIEDNWCPTFEQPPDDRDRKRFRMDIFVFQFGLEHVNAPGLLGPKLLIQIKGGGGSPSKVEEQALANAKASIRQYGLPRIYVQTIIGIESNLYFRFWRVDRNVSSLIPIINCGHPPGTHDGYILLDSELGAVLDECYNLVKTADPTDHGLGAQQPPEGGFPQPGHHGQYGYRQDQYYGDYQAGPSNEGYGDNEGHDVDMTGATDEQADETDVASDSDEEEQTAKAGAYGAQGVSTARRQKKEKNTILVEINKKTHHMTFKPTEYFFRKEGEDEDTRTFERHW